MSDPSVSKLPEFVASLRGRRFGIVYSHRFYSPLEEWWYHRWQTNIISFFSQAVEHLRGIPVFFNLDQFVQHVARTHANPDLDYVINLNAGNRLLDMWSIVPSLAGWRNIPVFPCDAFTVMLGEKKDSAKLVAAHLGWRVARVPDAIMDPSTIVVRKPLTFGSSVGLERLPLAQARQEPRGDDTLIEEFVPGYDATLVVLYSSVHETLTCLGAQAIIPKTDRPTEWMYDSFEKRHPGERTVLETVECSVDERLNSKAVELCRAFGAKAVSRIDVRLLRPPVPSVPITFDNCVLLEINPMPTTGPDNSVTKFAANLIQEHASHPSLAWLRAIGANPIESAACYMLATGLYAISSR